MLFKNIVFYVLKNSKLKIGFGFYIFFSKFLFRKIEICYENSFQTSPKVLFGKYF